VPTTAKTTLTVTEGASSGQVMLRNRDHAVTPSSAAASYTDAGREESAPMNSTIVKPRFCHTWTPMTRGSAESGEPKKAEWMPNSPRN